jgi:ElaB/YqjD/DUF883 family membrane-anchored ribosome-binding protein
MSENVAIDETADAADGENQTESLRSAEAALTDALKTAERLFKGLIENLGDRAKSYRDQAGFDFDDAQALIVAKVKERPLTAAAAGFGAGLILGLLLSNRSR